MNFLLKFILGGDSKPLEDAGDRGKKTLKELKQEYRDNVNEAAKWTAGIALAGAAMTVHLVNKAREAIDEQYALAQQLHQTMRTMATVEKAAGLVGVSYDKLIASSKILDQTIGKAAQGVEQQSDLFDRLKLSAQELAALPLDQRIVRINEAIRENIPLVEQAAVAAEMFGAKTASAMMMLDADAIAQAARETEILGHALDDVDAAKVDAANDSFGRIGEGISGLGKQLAVEVSPILDDLGKQFLAAAEEAGGMETVAKNAFDTIVTGAGFAMDALRGLHVVALGIDVIFAKVAVGAVNMYGMIAKGWVELGNLIPGIDVDYGSTWIGKLETEAMAGLGALQASLDELVNSPMPSTEFRKWVDEVRASAEAAAAEVVKTREELAGGNEDAPGAPDPEHEKFREQLSTKLEALRESLLSELELEREKYKESQAILDNALAEKMISSEEHQRQLEELAMQHHGKITKIEEEAAARRKAIADQEAKAKFQKMQTVLGDISTLMNTESRKLFEIGKAAAIASAIVDTHAGMTKALAQGGFWGIAMAAAVAAKGFASVSAIRSQQFGGGGQGAQATGSNTAAVNAATTPVGGAKSGDGRGMSTVVYLQGDNYSRSSVRNLIEQLNESQRDGGRITIGE